MQIERTLFKALVRAHGKGERDEFRSYALMASAKERSDPERAALAAHIDRCLGAAGAPTAAELPKEVRELLFEPSSPDEGELVLEDGTRRQLDAVGREWASREALAAHGLRPTGRLLFVGPPGNGKTSAASRLAADRGLPLYAVDLSTLVGSLLGETAARLAVIFRAVATLPCVLFLDEVDTVGAHRSADGIAGREQSNTVNALLQLLDRHPGVTVVAATNREAVLDPALVRRFDVAVRFPVIGEAGRRAWLASRLAGSGVPVERIAAAAALAPGLDMASFTRGIERAMRRAVVEGEPPSPEGFRAAIEEQAAGIVLARTEGDA